MKTPAPGGNPGRAVTSEQRSKFTAHSSENPASTAYVLRLEPLPGIDGTLALREALKRLRRNHGMRCLACTEEAGR
jgi:hypothetical protein